MYLSSMSQSCHSDFFSVKRLWLMLMLYVGLRFGNLLFCIIKTSIVFFPRAHANGASHSCLSFCNIQTSPPQPQHISLSESFVYAANFQDSNAFNTLIAKYNILSSTIITDLTGKGILSTIPLLIFSWHILYYLLQKVICDYLNRNYLWCHMLECRILFLLIIVKSSGYKFPFQMDFN